MDKDAVRRSQRENEERRSGGGLKLVDGINRLRLIPHKKLGVPWIPLFQHFGVDSLVDTEKSAWGCRKKTAAKYGGDKECPVCKEYMKYRRKVADMDEDHPEYEATKQMRDRLSPKRRFRALAVNRKEEEKGIQPWNFGIKIYEMLISAITDEDDPKGFIDVDDPECGHDIIIDAEIKQRAMANYKSVKARSKGSALGIKNWKKKMEAVGDLIEMVKSEMKDAAKLVTLFAEGPKDDEGEDDEGEDDEGEEKVGKKDDSDDDDDDSDDEEEDDDDDDSDDEEEDEDDDDSDDEEEDEDDELEKEREMAAKKKKKAAKKAKTKKGKKGKKGKK